MRLGFTRNVAGSQGDWRNWWGKGIELMGFMTLCYNTIIEIAEGEYRLSIILLLKHLHSAINRIIQSFLTKLDNPYHLKLTSGVVLH